LKQAEYGCVFFPTNSLEGGSIEKVILPWWWHQ
jgi:hypothetical protein